MAHRNRSRNGTRIAALPMRWGADGTLYVLMVMERGSGRWVMPKGWHIDASKPWKTAEIEALDAAGAVGHVGINPIGRYFVDRPMPGESPGKVEVVVFPMVVERLRSNWKNRRRCKRRWFEGLEAARHVEEAELAALLRKLAVKPPRRTTTGRFLLWFD